MYVYAGNYGDTGMTPPSNVTIQGESAATVIIDSSPGQVFALSNGGVTLKDMTLQTGTGLGNSAVAATAAATLSGLIISDSGGYGVHADMGGASITLTISGCTISSSDVGVVGVNNADLNITGTTITSSGTTAVSAQANATVSIGGSSQLTAGGTGPPISLSGGTHSVSSMTLNTTGSPTHAISCLTGTEDVTCGAGIVDTTGMGTDAACTTVGSCP